MMGIYRSRCARQNPAWIMHHIFHHRFHMPENWWRDRIWYMASNGPYLPQEIRSFIFDASGRSINKNAPYPIYAMIWGICDPWLYICFYIFFYGFSIHSVPSIIWILRIQIWCQNCGSCIINYCNLSVLSSCENNSFNLSFQKSWCGLGNIWCRISWLFFKIAFKICQIFYYFFIKPQQFCLLWWH